MIKNLFLLKFLVTKKNGYKSDINLEGSRDVLNYNVVMPPIVEKFN